MQILEYYDDEKVRRESKEYSMNVPAETIHVYLILELKCLLREVLVKQLNILKV